MPDGGSLEQLQEPDLLEAFADREVTVFGFTGTFRDLADMCPVDLSDPRVTLDAKNDFVVKAANEAGLAIAPEHEETFTRVTEKHGLERKFTVAEPPGAGPPSVIVRPKDFVPKATVRIEQVITPPDSRADPAVLVQQERTTTEVVMAEATSGVATEVPESNEMAYQETVATHTQEQTFQDEPVVHALSERMLQEAQVQRPEPEGEAMSVSTKDVVMMPVEASMQRVVEQKALPLTQPNSESAPVESDMLSLPSIPAESFSEATLPAMDHVLAFDAASAEATAETVQVAWADELTKEPVEIYEDFTAALQTFGELSEMPATDSERDLFEVQPHDEFAEQAPVPPVAAEVSKRLAALDDEAKETIAPMVKDIIGTMHGLQLLEASSAEPETVVAIEAQLEELCKELLGAIGIEPDDEAVKQFIDVLRNPRFRPPQPELSQQLDLKHIGTHEAKGPFAQLGGTISDIEHQAERIIGKLILFYVPHSTQAQLQLAA